MPAEPFQMGKNKEDIGSALRVMSGIEQPNPINTEAVGKIRSRKKSLPGKQESLDGILSGNRTILSKTITLIESSLPSHQQVAQEIIAACLPYSGKSIRVGITGVPGVGKSTFIEALGTYLTGNGYKLAVLAIDPSSSRSKGSILGDKTRMEELSVDPDAFIRPSPSAGSLGGVARKSRETIILCEAAGFDVIFVETVGVGQSETTVHSMVDFFLLLMLAGAGDELQGIKRGIIEMADAIVINKADGDNFSKALSARVEYANALHLFPPSDTDWTPVADICSSRTKEGIDRVWNIILDHHTLMTQNGKFHQRRMEQNRQVLFDSIEEGLRTHFFSRKDITSLLPGIEKEITTGLMNPYAAAQNLLDSYFHKHSG